LAKTRQVLFSSGTKALAESDQKKQGSNAPCDSEHREERAKFVRPDGTQDLSETINKSPHKYVTSVRRMKFIFTMEIEAFRIKN
jgi:hypothetical protein